MTPEDARRLIATGAVTGGMIPKLDTCLEAVVRGVDAALVETVTHAGRSVIVSGSTVAIGLLALIEGWVDAVVADFIAGAAERLVLILLALLVVRRGCPGRQCQRP